ncbi:MAG: hypothetical protein FWD17_17255, partial [Polyangiaceae bacterium]|nr:hypothetical protein [Polyangiaceae bacterium]
SRAVWLREGRPCTSEERPTAPTLPRVAQTASANHGNRAAAPPATRPDPRPESARTRLVAGAGTVATHRAPSVDDLDREASLLATARAALARGDAAGALHAVHATMVLRDRQLVPEELAIEAQALRALGRLDDAKALEERLRAKFPDSALAR